MNFFAKYLLPGIALTLIVFETCHRSADKDKKTGKAGDQFDLFAVMHTLQNSSSPEAFEKSLNSKSTGVNNLDLNEDGQTDYIKVIDKKIDAQSHVLILQVDVAPGKTQDIATVEIEKSGENEAHLQIIGDEDLYGSAYIIEPKKDQAASGFVVATTFAVNVWSWPMVTYIYSSAYVVWASPYYYDYYPVWWDPWPVVVYDVYYPTVSVYHLNYAISDGYRFVNVHENYHSHYRVTTRFDYHEKSYGSGEKIKIRDKGSRDGGGPWHDNDRKTSPGRKDNSGPRHDGFGGDKKSPGNDKRDVKPLNDHNKQKGGEANRDARQNTNGSPGKDRSGGGAPKHDVKKNTPSGRSAAPSGSKQNHQGGGGHQNGGGHGGGGKHR